MNIKFNATLASGFLALTSFLVQAKADEWDKKTEFTFSAPVQIPGKVLPAGKYVFQLVDSQSDRNIVQVFSEDSEGKQSLVMTVMAVPDYMTETPDKPIIHMQEQSAGNPEVIHNWFYPGDNAGWQFVYSKEQTAQATQASTTTTPAPAPVAAAPAPSERPKPPALLAPGTEPASEVAVVEDEVLIAQSETPPAPPVQTNDTPSTPDPVLPQTAGNAGLQVATGLVLLGSGITVVLISRGKSLASKSLV